jgi:AcrR family transcriptional regulator
MSNVRNPHADSRLPRVLDEAARLFRTRGFEGTSVREIAKAVGMLPGSLYCHFETKEALLVAVYIKGVQQIIEAVQSAVRDIADPWERLEAACVAHLEAILRDDDYAQVVVRVRPADVPVAHQSLIELRNSYEDLFTGLIKDLPLARGTDRRVLRLMLIGAMNWSQTWYRPGGRFNPRAIARKFIALLRQGQEVTQ